MISQNRISDSINIHITKLYWKEELDFGHNENQAAGFVSKTKSG